MRLAGAAAIVRTALWRLKGLRRDRKKAQRRATALYAAGIAAGGFGMYWFLRRSGAFEEEQPAWMGKKQRKEARRTEAQRRAREEEQRSPGGFHVELNAPTDLAVSLDETLKRR